MEKKLYFKSLFRGWVEITEEQKERLVNYLRNNTPAIKEENKQEYIKSRFKIA